MADERQEFIDAFGFAPEEVEKVPVESEEVQEEKENITNEQVESVEESEEDTATLSDENEAENVTEEQEEPQVNDEEIYNTLKDKEKEAWDLGWRPKDYFEGDEDNFVSAHEYIRYGKLKEKLDETKKEFDYFKKTQEDQYKRFQDLKELQLKQKMQELEERESQAVADADLDEFNKIKKEREELKETYTDKVEEVSQVQSKPQQILDWEAKNPWVNDPNDVRAKEAGALYSTYVNAIADPNGNPNDIIAAGLKYVEDKMGLTKKPEHKINPMRKSAPVTQVKEAQKVDTEKRLSFSDLTRDEMIDYENMKTLDRNLTKKDYVKLVQEYRKENNNG